MLQAAGLQQYIDKLPVDTNQMTGLVTMGQYASLSQTLANLYGDEGRRVARQIGINGAHSAPLEFALPTLGQAATQAMYAAPEPMRGRVGLEALHLVYDEIYRSNGLPKLDIRIEEHDGKFYYILTQCAVCAGWQAEAPICELVCANLQAGMEALFPGRSFQVQETECRAMGQRACVFEIAPQA
jgi:predicted hydrocarbon binding protein